MYARVKWFLKTVSEDDVVTWGGKLFHNLIVSGKKECLMIILQYLFIVWKLITSQLEALALYNSNKTISVGLAFVIIVLCVWLLDTK